METALLQLGGRFARFITGPSVIMAMRTVVAISARMPELGAEFYGDGPRRCALRLGEYLEAQVKAGVLAIDDIPLASAQFFDLVQSTLTRPLLFGLDAPPTEERIDAVVASAVRLFLGAYGKPTAPTD